MDNGKMIVKNQFTVLGGKYYCLILSHFSNRLYHHIIINGKKYKFESVYDLHVPAIAIPKTEELDLVGCVVEEGDFKD